MKSLIKHLKQHYYDMVFAYCFFFWNLFAAIHEDYDNMEPILRNTVTFFFFYFAIRCFVSKVSQRLPLYILGGLTICKVLQLFRIHELLGLHDSVLFLTFFEPDFHILDIPNYFVICLSIYLFITIQQKHENSVLFNIVLLIFIAAFMLGVPVLLEHVEFISTERLEKILSNTLLYCIFVVAVIGIAVYYLYADKIIAKSPMLQSYMSEHYRRRCNKLYDAKKKYKNMLTEIRFHSVLKYYCVFLCCLIVFVPCKRLFVMNTSSVFAGNILYGIFLVVTTFVIISVMAVMFHRRITYFTDELRKSNYPQSDIEQDYMKGISTTLYIGVLNISPRYTIFASHLRAFILLNEDIIEVKKYYSVIEISTKKGTFFIREGNAFEQAVALKLFQRYSITVVNENPYNYYL